MDLFLKSNVTFTVTLLRTYLQQNIDKGDKFILQ